VFVALIDTRGRWEPEPEPEPEGRRSRRVAVPWRDVAACVVVLALLIAAGVTDGIVAYGFVLAGVTVGSLAVDRAYTYRYGMTEYRQ